MIMRVMLIGYRFLDFRCLLKIGNDRTSRSSQSHDFMKSLVVMVILVKDGEMMMLTGY